MATGRPCPACEEAAFAPLVDFGLVPRSGTFLETVQASVPFEQLRYEFCPSCGLIRRTASGVAGADYSDVGRLTARQQPHYVDHVVARLRDSVDPDALVVEVGANDGALLDRLAAAGFQDLLGVEPSRTASDVLAQKGHRVACVHLDDQSSEELLAGYGAAAAVVCRHTLEHVPDPGAFLRATRLLLADGGHLFLEVPDGEPIVAELHGHELWDEHLHMFTAGNLPAAVAGAGFAVDEVERRPHLASHNVLLWARKLDADRIAPEPVDVGPYETFAARWEQASAAFGAAVAASQGPVVALGASHPQTNYLIFSGVGGHVEYLVDDDTGKVGRFVPVPQPVPVVPSAQLLSGRQSAGTILRTAFGYNAWMDPLCRAQEASVLDPLAHLEAAVAQA